MKKFSFILILTALAFVSAVSFATKRDKVLSDADQGRYYPYAGGVADTIVLNDTVSYQLFVAHLNSVVPELHTYYDKIGTGNPTLKLDIYQSMDGQRWSTVKKGKAQGAWTKSFSPTADGELVISAALDTAYFTGRYIKYQFSTGNTANTKGKFYHYFKTNIK